MSKNPSTRISANSLSVKEVFKSSYFEVPPNQREYRWENEQLEKFWDDLIATAQNDCIDNPGDPIGHFLGAVVVIGQEHSIEQNRWQVIDGQQRLITITILAECLREFVEEISDTKTRRGLSHVLWDCVVSPGAQTHPRIIINRDDEFYRNSLISNDCKTARENYWNDNFNNKSEVQSNIKYAFNFFYEKINMHLSNRSDKDNAIRDLADTLTEGFYLILARTENTWMAYTLFETLNERGMDLSQADLIKNVLLENARYIGDATFKKVSLFWSEMVDNYEQQSSKKLELSQIIQFSYTYRHKQVKKEKIFETISKDLRLSQHDALELCTEFKKDSQNWCAFLLGDLMNWSERLADSQYAIIEPLWKSHCVPFVMACMDKFSSSEVIFEKAMLLCENFLFREGLVGNASVSSLQDVFGQAASHVKSGQNFSSIVNFFKKYSSDEAFKESFKTTSVSNMKQGFYTIWKIEKFLSDEVEFRPKSQSAAQHLEHIMPRKPDATWGGLAQSEGFSYYLNSIGNFLILPSNVNQHIKNKPLSFKLSNPSAYDYNECNLKLVEEFISNWGNWSDNGSWGFSSIRKRQAHLAETYALKVWSLNIES